MALHHPPTFARQPAALAAILVCCALAGAPTHAQTAATPAAATPQAFDLPAQPLGSALARIAATAGRQISIDAELVRGRAAPAVRGSYTPEQAAQAALAGSGLELVHTAAGNWGLRSAAPSVAHPAAAPTERAMAEVRVTAQAQVSPTTEQTGSYTTRALSIGKMQLSIRETPQSVTVVTRQQMDDQNLATIEDVIAQTTGTSKSQRNFGSHTYTMRGFVIPDDNYLIDGVSSGALSPTGWIPMDTAIFDRVEVLRGAGALVVGAGDPSGVINMVRKRPRAEAHVEVAQSIGSWSNYRTEIDAGGPINQAGTVRGRVVAAYTDRDYFYDVAHTREPMVYGVVDADLGSRTRLTGGYRHQTVDTPGYTIYGLPSYTTGASLNLPRSTSLGQNWNRHKARTNDFFAELAHSFDGDWKGKITANHGSSDYTQKLSTARGAIDPTTLTGARTVSQYFSSRDLDYSGLDANLVGSFQALGGTHQLLVGAMWSRQDTLIGNTTVPQSIAVDIFNFNHALIPEPASPTTYATRQRQRVETTGLYASTRLELDKRLHLSLGGRLNWYKFRTDNLATGAVLNNYKQDAELTPYAGLVYDLDPNWSAYASYADTFVTQSQYISATGGGFDPAVGTNLEAGVKGEFFDRRLNVAFAVFDIKKRNVALYDNSTLPSCPGGMIITTGDCYRAVSVRSKGFEAEVGGQLARGWQVAGGYTYLTSKDSSGAPLTSDAPRNLLRVSSSYNFGGDWSAWTVGANVATQSRASVDTVRNPGHTVLDLRASYRINPHWTAALNINNVTDKTYWAAIGGTIGGSYYGTPRNAMLTLRGAF